MNRAEFLRAFDQLSADDRNAVRAEISKKVSSEQGCCTPPMMAQLSGMMKKMESSENPMAMFQEMMKMCGEKVAAKCGT